MMLSWWRRCLAGQSRRLRSGSCTRYQSLVCWFRGGGRALRGWIAAVGRDSAVGLVAIAADAGTPAATAWVTREWFADVVEVMVHQAHWWILVCAWDLGWG